MRPAPLSLSERFEVVHPTFGEQILLENPFNELREYADNYLDSDGRDVVFSAGDNFIPGASGDDTESFATEVLNERMNHQFELLQTFDHTLFSGHALCLSDLESTQAELEDPTISNVAAAFHELGKDF